MPLVLLEANEICVVCGRLIRRTTAYFRAADKNRFRYKVCDSCRQTLDEERRKLGLQVKRGAEILKLYTMARYVLQQGYESTELKSYIEWIDHFVTVSRDEPFRKSRSRLAEVGILEESVSRTITSRQLALSPSILESVKSSAKSFTDEVDKAQEKRRRRARKLYKMRESGEIDANVGPLVFDMLFDPLE